MPDINELAEKKLKSRVRKIKKVNKSDEEKEKFFVQLGASVEIFFPNKKPEELISSIFLLLNNFELEVDELIEICEKYNIDKSNFNNYYFSKQFKILKKQSDNQIFIDFYQEEREVA